MVAHQDNDRTPLETDLRELEKLRRLIAHKEIGIARAMHYCATYNINPPDWLVEEAASLMIDLLKRERSTSRGRTATHLSRFRQESWDLERWFAVHEVRRIRGRVDRDDAVLKDSPDRNATKAWKKHHERLKEWLKAGTFECAVGLLEGRDAYASPSAIRASYRRVERVRAKPDQAVGAWFDDAFRQRLGLQGASDSKRDKKSAVFLT